MNLRKTKALSITANLPAILLACDVVFPSDRQPIGSTSSPVSKTDRQGWARVFDEAGLGGVRYASRFTTGRAGSVAIFGAAGNRADWPLDDSPLAAADLPGAPVLRTTPRLDELTVVPTPRRRGRRAAQR